MQMAYRIMVAFVVVFVLGVDSLGVISVLAQKKSALEDSLRQFSRQILDAYERRDAAALKSFYAKEPEAVFFWERQMSSTWPQVEATIDAFVKNVAKVKMTASEMRAGGAGNTGWLAAKFHVEREMVDGTKMTTDGRWTMVAEKRNGRWMIVHEHASFPLPKTSGQVHWKLEKTTGDKPSPRGGGKWVPVGNKIVMFAGFYECFDKTKCEHVYFDDVYIFDTTTNRWERKQPISGTGGLPGARAFLGGATYVNNNSAVFFGGTYYTVNLKPAHVYGDMWEYHPETNTFTEIHYANEGPGARLGAEIVIKDDMLYSFGGYDSSFKAHNDLWSFNLKTRLWQRLKADNDPNSPSKRYIFRFQLSDSGEDIYIFGGNYREAYTIQRNDLWKYNIATNTFTALVSETDTNITGRTHGACAVFGDMFLIALGDIPSGGCFTAQASEHQNPTNEVWRVGVNSSGIKKWEKVEIGHGPPPLKRLLYAQVGDKLYVTHGFDYICDNPETAGPIYNLDTYSLSLKQIR